MVVVTEERLKRHWNGVWRASVEFAILGPLEALDQHRWIDVSSAKERLLLAVLVVHVNEVVSTDRLIEVLWGRSRRPPRRTRCKFTFPTCAGVLEPDRALRARDGMLRTCGQGYVLEPYPSRSMPFGSSGWPMRVARHFGARAARQGSAGAAARPPR